MRRVAGDRMRAARDPGGQTLSSPSRARQEAVYGNRKGRWGYEKKVTFTGL
jgi:hypothetical protein